MIDPALRWPNWIGVVCEDLDAQRRFYGEVLGLPELDAGDGWVQFDFGWPNMLELLARTDQPQYDRVRVQVGFAVDDIEASGEALVTRGVEAITAVEGGAEAGGAWRYFRDPEGNVFEITQRLAREEATDQPGA
jgi:catechol 2,3-dioxygenase-like lactoylglutathione lyase family enzyme